MESQKQRRPVQRNRVTSNDCNRASDGERQICLPLSEQRYDDIWDDAMKVRIWIDEMIERSPEMFPQQIADGYQLKGKLHASAKMPNIQLRQIHIAGQRYYLRPSFVMPAFAVESFPVANAEIYPEFQFAIEYRKRFDFLPGAVHKLIGVDLVDITQLRSEAVTAYDWSLPDLRGTTYCFVRDYEPLPGWTKRDPISGPGSAGLN